MALPQECKNDSACLANSLQKHTEELPNDIDRSKITVESLLALCNLAVNKIRLGVSC